VSHEVDPVAWRVEIASELASALHSVDRDGAVILFGSSARGDATEHSDLDLLVISTHRGGTEAARELSREVRSMRVSLLTHTWSSFARLRHDDWLFVRHLSEEAVALWDPHGEFGRRSEVAYPGDRAVTDQIRQHSQGLTQLSDVERYGGDFLFPLAGVYALAKRIAMLANSRRGVSIFDRERALLACGDLFPAAAEDLSALRRLAPFYALTRGIRSMHTPFSSDDAGPILLEHTAALVRVVETVCA
jgi:predicted nucleotidyltransferase